MSTLVPAIHFDTASLPEEQRFAAWASALDSHQVSRPEDAEPFSAVVDAWMLGDVVVTSNRLPAVRFVRTAEMALADGLDGYSFLLLLQGSWAGRVGDRLVTVGPGQVAVFDRTRPVDAQGSASHSITLAVTRRAFDAQLPGAPDLHGLVLEGPAGRLIADHLISLVGKLPITEMRDIPAVTRMTIGLLAGALSASETGFSATFDTALRHRIRRHIDQNLESPGLTPERIARDLGISRSALYRVFPGIAAYLGTRRLEAVHVLLADPQERRGIAELAYRFGFVSDAHFSRAFKRRFGCAPRDARARGRTLAELALIVEPLPATAAFREWMARLR